MWLWYVATSCPLCVVTGRTNHQLGRTVLQAPVQGGAFLSVSMWTDQRCWCLAVLVFSTLVYYVELMELQAEPDDPRVTFRSIPATFWWSVVTLLTVGYGDAVPGTTSGKIVAAVSMVVAVLLMTLPVSVIGTTFTQQWVMFRAKERREARTGKSYDTLHDLVRHLTEHAQVCHRYPADVWISGRVCICEAGESWYLQFLAVNLWEGLRGGGQARAASGFLTVATGVACGPSEAQVQAISCCALREVAVDKSSWGTTLQFDTRC